MLKIYLKFICFWLHWVFVASGAFLYLQRARATLQLQCMDFSFQWILLLLCVVSVCLLSSCDSPALEHRIITCGLQAQLFSGMWEFPGSGIKPVCPTLAGGFFTSEPQGKPQSLFLYTYLGANELGEFRLLCRQGVDVLNDYCVSRKCFTHFLFFKNDGLFVLHNRTDMNHLLMS